MITAGVDVSLNSLDVVVNGGRIRRVPNAPDDARELGLELVKAGVDLIVMEATGGYQRAAHLALAEAGLKVAVVNPRMIRDYAKSHGLLEKTDAIDARILAKFASERQPAATPAPSAEEFELKTLVARRQQLADLKAQEKNRAAHPFGGYKESIARITTALAAEIKIVDREILRVIKATPSWCERFNLLRTIPGVGPCVASVLLATVPELGTLSNKAAAKLVGVAPLPWDSGQLRGQRHIAGGREHPRSMLYMAAMVGLVHNPVIKNFYSSLRARGKQGSVAIVACMRKLIVIANAMLRDKREWQTPSAITS